MLNKTSEEDVTCGKVEMDHWQRVHVSSFSFRSGSSLLDIFKPMNFLYPRTVYHIAAIGEATSGTERMKKSARDTEERYVE